MKMKKEGRGDIMESKKYFRISASVRIYNKHYLNLDTVNL